MLGLYEFYCSLSKAGDDLDPKIFRTKEKGLYHNSYHLLRTALARDPQDLMIAASALDTETILVGQAQVFKKLQQVSPDLHFEDWATQPFLGS